LRACLVPFRRYGKAGVDALANAGVVEPHMCLWDMAPGVAAHFCSHRLSGSVRWHGGRCRPCGPCLPWAIIPMLATLCVCDDGHSVPGSQRQLSDGEPRLGEWRVCARRRIRGLRDLHSRRLPDRYRSA
jgi:hypothetical protein